VKAFAMKRMTIACLTTVLTASACVAIAAEPVFSGPQPGEKLATFQFRNVLARDTPDVDLMQSAGDGPVLIVFVHVRNRPAFGLSNALMRYAVTRRDAGLTSGLIYLTDDVTEATNWMQKVRNVFPAGATIGISPEGIEGPGSYGLNRDVQVTVLVGKKGRTTASFALVQPSLEADGPKIAEALAKVLGDRKPVNLSRFSAAQMRKAETRPERTASGQRSQLPPEIVSKLRAVIQKNNTPEQVEKAALALEQALAEDQDSARRVGEITGRIISTGVLERYGTERAREYLRKWAGKYAVKKKPENPSPRDSKVTPVQRPSDGRPAGQNPD